MKLVVYFVLSVALEAYVDILGQNMPKRYLIHLPSSTLLCESAL